jgi:hypothetical protein
MISSWGYRYKYKIKHILPLLLPGDLDSLLGVESHKNSHFTGERLSADLV